mgnify:FL=1
MVWRVRNIALTSLSCGLIMKKPAFIITIDTEGDNLWQNHRVIKTENARYLARLQTL